MWVKDRFTSPPRAPGRCAGIFGANGLVNRAPTSVGDIFILKGQFAHTALSGLFRLYPDELLKRQSARANAFTPAVQEYLYSVFCQIPKEDFLTIFLETFKCLHYEPNYRIPRPLLLLVGEHDTMGNIRKVAPQWVSRDSCQYRVIPDAGHCAQLDNPAAVQPLVLDFLASFYGQS